MSDTRTTEQDAIEAEMRRLQRQNTALRVLLGRALAVLAANADGDTALMTEIRYELGR